MSTAVAPMTSRFSQPGASATPATEVYWRVIVKKQKTLQLHLLHLSPTQTGVTVIHTLRKKYESTSPTRHWWHAEPMISEAIISPFCIGDPESQDYPREIIVASSTPRPDLTDAFHNPGVLRGAANFIYLNRKFDILSSSDQHGQYHRAVFITNDINKYTLAWVISAVVLLSILVGVVVGNLVDWSSGVATATGIISLFGLVQGFIFGMYK